MKNIGAAFGDELETAGLLGLPFSWGSDGTFQFDARMTQDQIDAVNLVYEAHDPTANSNMADDLLDTIAVWVSQQPNAPADITTIISKKGQMQKK